MLKRYTYQEFIRLQQHRARGIEFATELFGEISDLIDNFLLSRKQVRILELGFGFGMLLFELSQKFGSKVKLVGINKKKSDGTWNMALTSAVLKGIVTEQDAVTVNPPKLLYHDLNSGIPLPDNSFDLVISQVCLFNVKHKAYCIEEVNRVLVSGGIGLLDLMIIRDELEEPYKTSFSILLNGRKISFWKYLRRFNNLTMKKCKRRNFLFLEKVDALDLGLELEQSFDLSEIDPSLKGIVSEYKCNKNCMVAQLGHTVSCKSIL